MTGTERYRNIVFLDHEQSQDDKGRLVTDQALRILHHRPLRSQSVVWEMPTEESAEAALDYLLQWDYGEDEINAEPSGGSGDNTLRMERDGRTFLITYNTGLSYIGLEEVLPGPEPVAVRAGRGAALLDYQLPGWAGQIDTGRLDIAGNCILSQLFRIDPPDQGYYPGDPYLDALRTGERFLFGYVVSGPRAPMRYLLASHGLYSAEGGALYNADCDALTGAWLVLIAERTGQEQ